MAAMSSSFQNPYATTSTNAMNQDYYVVQENELASRITRLGAAMLDGILVWLVFGPILYLNHYYKLSSQLASQLAPQNVGLFEAIGMNVLGEVAFLAINGYTLATRGQTIGKLIGKIQIVDFNSSKLVPVWKLFVLRHLWKFPFGIITLLIPGSLDTQIFWGITTIGILMIFGPARRCLHDYIAGTKVIKYREGTAVAVQ